MGARTPPASVSDAGTTQQAGISVRCGARSAEAVVAATVISMAMGFNEGRKALAVLFPRAASSGTASAGAWNNFQA